MSIAPFFKRCPKSGRVVGLSRHIPLRRVLWPLLGLAALTWFCLRTFSKPSRLSYPCQQAVAPIAAGFLLWLAGFFASASLVRASKSLWRDHKFASVMALVGAIGVWVALGPNYVLQPLAQVGQTTGLFVAKDLPNTPMGTAKGIKPGRVSWAHDPSAILYTGQGSYTEDKNFNQDRLDNMLRSVVISVPGEADLSAAWTSILTSNNVSRGRPAKGYTAGEKFAIKVNVNSKGSLTAVDQTPQLVKSLLRQLVDTLKVPQANILVFDAVRSGADDGLGTIKRFCQGQFPNVRYNNFSHPSGEWVNSIKYSNNINVSAGAHEISRWVAEADYYINFAILKRHSRPQTPWEDNVGQAGVTLTAKNNCGTIRECWPLHEHMRDWFTGDKKYNVIVDLMAAPILYNKTVLYLLDGLFTANIHDGGALKWTMTPFNGNYPASVFASQDIVAIESVGLDFLNTEMKLVANADNYLHEAANIGTPPSGVNYVDHGTNTSLGVHEHWNNPIDKKYSRNLGTGQGIELYIVPLTGVPPIVKPPIIVPVSVANAKLWNASIEFEQQPGGKVMIKSASPLIEAEIFDARGKTLAKTALSGTQALIGSSGQSQAMYLRVRTEAGVTTRVFKDL